MPYHSKPISNERWGIYMNNKLIATIGCPDTCEKIIYFLQNRLSNERSPISKEGYAISQYCQNLKLKL